MRELNTSLVLDLIRRSDSICQADIARNTRLSAGTVTSIIKDLKKRKYIKKLGPGESNRGRRPTMLRFNPEAQYVIGVEFYADEMNIGVLDLAGKIKKHVYRPISHEKNPRTVFKNFAEGADSLLQDFHINKENILGIGASFEGIVDHDKGLVVLSNRFGWRNVPVKDIIKEEYGLQPFVECDVRVMALGEHWYGAGQGIGDLVCIEVDSGIGAGVISGGRLCTGVHSMGGEMGHSLAVPDGPECRCGMRGCLETVASGDAILSRVKRELQEGRESALSGVMNSLSDKRAAIRCVFAAAKQGDRFALEVIKKAGYHLGIAVANIINYADPEVVIFKGYVIDENKGALLDIIREVAQNRILDSNSRTVRIKEGALGRDAALIGAAVLVYRETFKLPLVQE